MKLTMVEFFTELRVGGVQQFPGAVVRGIHLGGVKPS